MQTSGTKLAGGCPDGTLVIWCYLTGKKTSFSATKDDKIFPMIIWNPLDLNVLASYNNAVRMSTKVELFERINTVHAFLLHLKMYLDWISRNRLACSYDDGTVEIHEIELNYKSNSQLVKKLVVSTHFTFKNDVFHFPKVRGMKSDVWSIA